MVFVLKKTKLFVIMDVIKTFLNKTFYRIHGNRTPAFYLFLRPLGWRIIRIWSNFTLKKGHFWQKSGVLIESGVLLPRIRYYYKSSFLCQSLRNLAKITNFNSWVGKIAWLSAWLDKDYRIFTNGELLSQSIFLWISLYNLILKYKKNLLEYFGYYMKFWYITIYRSQRHPYIEFIFV